MFHFSFSSDFENVLFNGQLMLKNLWMLSKNSTKTAMREKQKLIVKNDYWDLNIVCFRSVHFCFYKKIVLSSFQRQRIKVGHLVRMCNDVCVSLLLHQKATVKHVFELYIMSLSKKLLPIEHTECPRTKHRSI